MACEDALSVRARSAGLLQNASFAMRGRPLGKGAPDLHPDTFYLLGDDSHRLLAFSSIWLTFTGKPILGKIAVRVWFVMAL